MNSSYKAKLSELGYSELAIRLLENETHMGTMEVPTLCLSTESSCGDILVLYLIIRDRIIQEAKFQYIGCLGLQVASSAVLELAIGSQLPAALKISESDIYSYLENIPKEKHECVQFAVKSLNLALKKYRFGHKPSLFPEKII